LLVILLEVFVYFGCWFMVISPFSFLVLVLFVTESRAFK
jgi:hypothetical protein